MFYVVILACIIAMFCIRATRPYAAAILLALIALYAWDKIVTESPMLASQYEIRNVEAFDSTGARSGTMVYIVTMKVKNRSEDAELQDAKVQLELQDCTVTCRIIGREVKNFQFLAGPGEVREAREIFYVRNVVEARGRIIPKVSILEATGDK